MAYSESKYIDGLDVAPTLDGSELVPIFEGGLAKQTTTQDIADLVFVSTIKLSRVSTQFDKTSSTTLSNITGLSATLEAGTTYIFDIKLYTTSDTASGIKVSLNGGSATATSFIAESMLISNDGTSPTPKRLTALNSTHGVTIADTTGYIEISGNITVNVGGTFIPQFAQNVSGVVASSVLVGSSMVITQIN